MGVGDTADRYAPTQVGTQGGWGNLSLNGDVTMAIRADGSLWAWGLGENWALGLGSNVNVTAPTQVPGVRARLIAVGYYVTLVAA